MSGGVLLPDFLAVLRSPGVVPVEADAVRVRPALDWELFIAERLEAGSRELYAECLGVMERQLLTRLLDRTGGNQLRAAALLGITRGSLRHKLRALGLTIARGVSADDDRDE
jgi:DNA-binding protein Fis